MRFAIAFLVMFSGTVFAQGPATSRGAMVLTFDGKGCRPDSSKSLTFDSGAFPFTDLKSRVETVSDVSENDAEIRLRLRGWVKDMSDYRNADLMIRGSVEALNKFRSNPNMDSGYLRVTTDPRCAKIAALVDVVEYVYDWKPQVATAQSPSQQP